MEVGLKYLAGTDDSLRYSPPRVETQWDDLFIHFSFIFNDDRVWKQIERLMVMK